MFFYFIFHSGIILSTPHFFLIKYESNDNETERVGIFLARQPAHFQQRYLKNSDNSLW